MGTDRLAHSEDEAKAQHQLAGRKEVLAATHHEAASAQVLSSGSRFRHLQRTECTTVSQGVTIGSCAADHTHLLAVDPPGTGDDASLPS